MFPQLYHAHHNRYREDVPFWLELAAKTSDPVLELGCGTGRVLVPLAEAGHHAIGLDRDLGMVKFLRGNVEGKALIPPLIFVADLCEFHLSAQFPLIILPCNTFSTLGDIQRKACLARVRMHLRANGIFAVSIPNPELFRHLPAHSDAELEDEFMHPLSGNPVQVSSAWQRKNDRFVVSWTYDHLFPDGTVDHLTVDTVHQLTPFDTYMEDFQWAGLKVIQVYGEFDRSGYTNGSPYLIIQAIHRDY